MSISITNNFQLLNNNLNRTQTSIIYSLHSEVLSPDSLLATNQTSSSNASFKFLDDLKFIATDITSSQTEQLKSFLVKYHQCFDDKL